tara:strand:- start:1964 stop:2596 length:633 start_codon:yes stop_codon:yes gene_type:complete
MLKTKNHKKEIYISKNLDYLLKQHQIDIKNLSIATGVPAPSISRLKKEGANPTISTIEPLLEFFKVDMKSFLYDDLSSSVYQKRKLASNFVPVPVYTLENFDKKKSVLTKFIGASGIKNANSFGVELNSDSLFPVFQRNSVIILDPDSKPIEGDYVLCRLGEDKSPVFRRVLFDGNTIYFKPINPDFGDLVQPKNYEIIGVVIKSIESFR